MRLDQFLALAKKSTYAKSGEGGEEKLPDGGRRFTFEQGAFRYQDTYYGFNPFSGQERVWSHGTIIWTMNYWGSTCSINVSAAAIYEFLKKALIQVIAPLPFRGPKQYQDGKWEYQCTSNGDLAEFDGSEIISLETMTVYFLKFHGGLVK